MRKRNWQNSDPELIEIERQFSETLGTRVQILKTDFGGKLTIDYFSSDELRKILELMEDVMSGTPLERAEEGIERAETEHIPEPETAPIEEEKKAEEEADLYSVRNFSL